MKQVTDTGAIEAAVDESHRRQSRQGRSRPRQSPLAGWFVGQVMKATGGKANPQAVNGEPHGRARS
jgi:aspartyl-tRNA(Asn)/glutamyl-tRNA(Gln) amidotransferase subunit B